MQICNNLNKERKRNELYKISDKYKKRRKPIRHLSKQKQDKNIEVEDTSYRAGGFQNYSFIYKYNIFMFLRFLIFSFFSNIPIYFCIFYMYDLKF